MNDTEMRALVERYLDAYNRMDVPAMLQTVHRDVTFRNVSGGVVTARADGIGELRALAEQSVSLFSERRQDILSFACDGPRALVSIRFRAVVADNLPSGLKKGAVLELSGRSEFEFRNGAIWTITDVS